MPPGSNLLTAFQRRDTIDKVMFGWVRCMTRTLPGVSVESALTSFAKEYHLEPKDFSITSQKTRYQRMVKEFLNEGRTIA